MSYYAGLDVSLEMTSICNVAGNGDVLRGGKTLSEPEAVVAFLRETGVALERVGLEAGALSEWLTVVCMETRQVKTALSAMTIKTDRHDARGIAQIARTGWFKVGLLQFSGGALRQLMAIFSNLTGLVKPSAEWRRAGL